MEEELMRLIVNEAFHLHKNLGPGLLENVYKTCLVHRLSKLEIPVWVEKPLPLMFEGVKMECGYRCDLIVKSKIIVEIKSIENISPLHISQMLTYLRLAELRLGLIINFNTQLIKNGLKRVVR